LLSTDLEVQRRRVEVLREELALAPQRMVGWGVAQAEMNKAPKAKKGAPQKSQTPKGQKKLVRYDPFRSDWGSG
jgi:hypothetical protein